MRNLTHYNTATTVTCIKLECIDNGVPVCAGPGPVSGSGEVMVFRSLCHLNEYNMEYSKRSEKIILFRLFPTIIFCYI